MKIETFINPCPFPVFMDTFNLPPDWFENRYEFNDYSRKSHNNNATMTERYQLKELLKAVNSLLSEVEERLRILEKNKHESKTPNGSQENQITPSFGILFFWFKMLEKKLASYSRKVCVETEFGPRVKIIRRKIRILARRDISNFHSRDKMGKPGVSG